jgi:hypothetical protein
MEWSPEPTKNKKKEMLIRFLKPISEFHFKEINIPPKEPSGPTKIKKRIVSTFLKADFETLPKEFNIPSKKPSGEAKTYKK